MLNIDLDLGDARVTNDEFNYIISHRKVKGKGANAGEEYWLAVSYHGSLDQVARELARLTLQGFNIADTKLFDKVTTLLEAEGARIKKLLEKKAK